MHDMCLCQIDVKMKKKKLERNTKDINIQPIMMFKRNYVYITD